MTWEPGRDVVARLLDADELQQVPIDAAVTTRLLADSERHLRTARAASDDGDLSGAYQLAYDACRKAMTAVLAEQGLRPTSRGGHVAVQDTIRAQFGTVDAFRAFGRLRRNRNQFEYPDSATSGPHEDDVTDALASAAAACEAVRRLIGAGALKPWR
jgi:HEPN domain-containing protein